MTPTENAPPSFIDGPNGRIAYRQRSGAGPGVIWCGGFRSDMLGTKANFIDDWARENNKAYLRFDYTGHGESDGRFEDGYISAWTADALSAFDALTDAPQIIIGSSMGAWIATLIAKQRLAQIHAAVFIAPAPDFTEQLMWPSFTERQRETIIRDGRIELPSDYADEPEVITHKLIEDGRENLVLSTPIPLSCPVRILQGMNDDAVPWDHAIKFAKNIQSDDVEITLTKSGDHRLSEPDDLERLIETLNSLY